MVNSSYIKLLKRTQEPVLHVVKNGFNELKALHLLGWKCALGSSDML